MAEVFDFGLQEHKIKMDGGFYNNGLFAVVGDTARRLEVQLLNSNNAIQDTTGINLRLNAEVAGKLTFVDAVVKDSTKGIYTVNLSNGMFLEPGNWEFQWQITKGANKISSFPFAIKIGQNISEGGAQATNFYLNAEELRLKTIELENKYQALINSTTGKDVISAPEIIAARKDKPNLNARLDSFETETTAQFQQTTSNLNDRGFNINMFSHLKAKVGDQWDWSIPIQTAIDLLENAEPNGIGGGGQIFGNGTFLISKPIVIQNHNTALKGVSKGGFVIKALPNFVGDSLLKWNPGEKWLFIQNNELSDVVFDCSNLAVKGVEIRKWYDNCNIRNVVVKNFKNVLGFDIDGNQAVGGTSIQQGIRIEGLEVNPKNLSNSPVAMFGNLFESTLINCKFWNAQADNTANSQDVVIFKRCRGVAVIGGSAASGKVGYVVVGEGVSPSEHVNFYTPTIENLQAGFEFRGSKEASVRYCNIYGIRRVNPVTTDIIYDYAIGCRLDLNFSFTKIILTSNSRSNMIFGFASGGTIENNHITNAIMTYGSSGLDINKALRLPNGTDLSDDTKSTAVLTANDKLQIFNKSGSVLLFETSTDQTLINSILRMKGQSTTTTAPVAGTAGDLPAKPSGYITIKINDVNRLIPYY